MRGNLRVVKAIDADRLDYSNRIRGDRAKNLEQSIEYHHSAPEVHSPESCSRELVTFRVDLARFSIEQVQNYQLAMEILQPYKQIFQQWGLSENPFAFTPPDEFAQVAKIFHGRSQELEIALPTLYEGRNVLIRGKWGIGKTALIKTLLHRLQQEVAEMNETMLVLYLGGIPKPTVIDFYRAVLLAVTKSISQHNNSWQSEDAKKVADSLAGIPIDSIKIKQEAGISLGVFNYKASIEPNSTSGGENDV